MVHDLGWSRLRLGLSLKVLVLLLVSGAASPLLLAEEAKLSPEKQAQIEAAVSKFLSSTHVAGVSVAIVENDAFEWASGFGLRTLRTTSPPANLLCSGWDQFPNP
jgi:hypothetical protein